MGQSDGKTEKATPQRRQKARSEGQVARSAEIGVAAGLAAMALGLRVFTPTAIDVLQRETATLFTASSQAVSLGLVGRSATTMMLALGAPLVAVGTGAAVVAGVGQVGLKPTTKAARPKLSHLSPKRGLERLKPATAGWELVRSVLKLGLLAAVMWGPLVAWAGARRARPGAGRGPRTGPRADLDAAAARGAARRGHRRARLRMEPAQARAGPEDVDRGHQAGSSCRAGSPASSTSTSCSTPRSVRSRRALVAAEVAA